MSSKSIKVLREQKDEYSEHLFEMVAEPFIRIFQGIYKDCLNAKDCKENAILKLFQNKLSKIPEWNSLKIEEVYKEILSKNKCSYFPELIKTVYTLTIKIILLGVPSQHRKNITVKIPTAEVFIHRCLIQIAREVWKRPFLFYHKTKSVEYQNNIHLCESIIRKKIKSVIRETIPMDLVISQFNNIDITEEVSESASGSDSDEEVATKSRLTEYAPEEAEESEKEEEAEEEESEEEEAEEEESEKEEEAEEEESEKEEEAEEEESEKEEEAEEEESEKEAEESEKEEEEPLRNEVLLLDYIPEPKAGLEESHLVEECRKEDIKNIEIPTKTSKHRRHNHHKKKGDAFF